MTDFKIGNRVKLGKLEGYITHLPIAANYCHVTFDGEVFQTEYIPINAISKVTKFKIGEKVIISGIIEECSHAHDVYYVRYIGGGSGYLIGTALTKVEDKP